MNLLRIVLLFIAAPAITLQADSFIRASAQQKYGVQAGGTLELKVFLQSTAQLGGVDFTIAYDDSFFTFNSAVKDTGLPNWEYFVYFHDDSLNTVRVVSIADMVNGPFHPRPEDFFPFGPAAKLTFHVSSSWPSDSFAAPLSFFWADCGDNAVSNKLGDTLTIDRRIFNPSGLLIWDELDSLSFPENSRPVHLGVPDSCLEGSEGIERIIDFQNGLAASYVICGNADANGIVNIVDITYLVSFIFSGGPPPDPLIAGDVNCSGTVNIADVVYLITYIFSSGPAPCAGC